ncbi:ComEA family DNA-binding protein [Marisediminicola sp. LYQ134]|uniref:ComEA family DNA-binding protein n=1 Tax=Marisediminicola sp. LYQ134 TaxID=3391061 RepID=UPI003983B8AA
MSSAARLVAAPRSRVRTTVGAVLVLVLVAAVTAVIVFSLGHRGSTTVIEPGQAPSDAVDADGSPSGDTTGSDGTPSALFVHILGAVSDPGLYELPSGARAVDVVAAAGGFTDDADRAGVNLARLVSDGEQIVIPAVGDAPPVAGPGGSPPAGIGSGGGDALVNLNTADAAALDTLPGVGPATAASILEWRETNGRFESVEDLLSVSGIGEKTFADLEPLVTI